MTEKTGSCRAIEEMVLDQGMDPIDTHTQSAIRGAAHLWTQEIEEWLSSLSDEQMAHAAVGDQDREMAEILARAPEGTHAYLDELFMGIC